MRPIRKYNADEIRGMILRMIETVWGNLRSRPARQAWAKAQTTRNKTDDDLFRQWLISQNVPDDIVRRAWEKGGTRFQALRYVRDQKDWIEYYNLVDEVNAAFKKHAPK